MKKFILKSVSLILTISLLSTQGFGVYAKSAVSSSVDLDESVFSFDEDLVNAALSELNTLDAYVVDNVDVTYGLLAETGSELIANIEANSSPMGMPQEGDDGPPLGIPSFLWGCVFGVLGLLVVYLMTHENKAETKKALWGCVTGSVVTVILYMVIWGAWAASEAAY